jgi:hypothetical protein
MEIFTIEVGFSTVRPIIVDQHKAWIIVEAASDIAANCLAAQVVATSATPGGFRGLHGCEMVTSTKIVSVEI